MGMISACGRREGGMVFDTELRRKIGTIACLLYAVVWVVAWYDPSPALMTMFDTFLHPPMRGGRYIPLMAAALLFGAAPFMRRDIRRAQIMVSLGIVLVISPALVVALQGDIPLGHVLAWVVVPLGIAVWVFFGPRDPDAEIRAAAEEAKTSIAVWKPCFCGPCGGVSLCARSSPRV